MVYGYYAPHQLLWSTAEQGDKEQGNNLNFSCFLTTSRRIRNIKMSQTHLCISVKKCSGAGFENL